MIEYRSLRVEEYPIIKEFLYQAIYIPEGHPIPNKDIVNHPNLLKYYQDFGREMDYGIAAVDNDQVVGLVWCRQFTKQEPGYGYYNDTYPEVDISILPAYRGKGIGSQLMKEFIYLVESNHVLGLSLSVTKGNYAQKLYERLGFQVIEERQEDVLMALHLSLK